MTISISTTVKKGVPNQVPAVYIRTRFPKLKIVLGIWLIPTCGQPSVVTVKVLVIFHSTGVGTRGIFI